MDRAEGWAGVQGGCQREDSAPPGCVRYRVEVEVGGRIYGAAFLVDTTTSRAMIAPDLDVRRGLDLMVRRVDQAIGAQQDPRERDA